MNTYPGLAGQRLPAMPWDDNDDADRSIMAAFAWVASGLSWLASLAWWGYVSGESDGVQPAVATTALTAVAMVGQVWLGWAIRRDNRRRYQVWLERHLTEVWQ